MLWNIKKVEKEEENKTSQIADKIVKHYSRETAGEWYLRKRQEKIEEVFLRIRKEEQESERLFVIENSIFHQKRQEMLRRYNGHH